MPYLEEPVCSPQVDILNDAIDGSVTSQMCSYSAEIIKHKHSTQVSTTRILIKLPGLLMFLVAVPEFMFCVSHPRHKAMGHNSVCHIFYSDEQIL